MRKSTVGVRWRKGGRLADFYSNIYALTTQQCDNHIGELKLRDCFLCWLLFRTS